MSNSKTRKKLQIFSLEYDVLKDKPQHKTEMRRGLECQPPHKLQTAGGSRRGGSIGPHVDSSEGFRPTRSSTRTGKGINTTSSKTTPWCLNSLWRCGLHFVPRPSCSTNTPLTPRQRGEQRGRAALLPFWMDTDESEGSWGIRADVFFFFCSSSLESIWGQTFPSEIPRAARVTTETNRCRRWSDAPILSDIKTSLCLSSANKHGGTQRRTHAMNKVNTVQYSVSFYSTGMRAFQI